MQASWGGDGRPGQGEGEEGARIGERLEQQPKTNSPYFAAPRRDLIEFLAQILSAQIQSQINPISDPRGAVYALCILLNTAAIFLR